MPVFILEESDYAGPIPEDMILPAEVTAIKQVEKKYKDDDGNPVQKVEFTFVVRDPSSAWDTQRLWGETSLKFVINENCKLRAWAQELMETQLNDPNFRLDTDDLVGLPCRIVVGLRTYEKDGEDKTINFVKDVIRAKSGSAFGGVDTAEDPF